MTTIDYKAVRSDITDFSKENFFAIESLWIEYKKKIKLPNWFFDELFDLCRRYKKGEKVGLHGTIERQNEEIEAQIS